MLLTRQVIRNAVEAALAEDAPNGDITCETTIPAQAQGEARLTAREQGVMSGVDVFAAAFAAQNPTYRSHAAYRGRGTFPARPGRLPPCAGRYVTCLPRNASP